MIDKNVRLMNTVIVMMDTAEKESIRIGKMENPPSSPEELKASVILDIATLCEALIVTIRTADGMGIKKEADSMRDVMNHLESAFCDPSLECYSPLDRED